MTSNVPSGTVTFLFTDIEGSTKRWEHQPELMQPAFDRQERIMRAAMTAHGGYIYKMIGDAFQVAFATAPDALAAALDAQRELEAEEWGEIGPIRVRMALHTGVTEERGDDYVGPLLNRVARLMSVGYGGQVLLTQTTYDLARDQLPAGAVFIDLGEHRLKDLIRLEHVYQLSAPGLASEFPPIKTLNKYRHNLPAQMTSFIGREKEIASIKQALAEHHLVTLTGSGGAGKTRLSLQVAADLLDQFPNGTWFVELAPITDSNLIPQTILSAAEMQTQQGRSALESLTDFLEEKTSLLILDNCEHLIEACAKLAETLLNAAPNLKILVSSREALGVKGEQAWHVPSLSIPDVNHPLPIEQLSQYEAVRLFIDRAVLVQPHFAVKNDNASAVAQICSRLDGIPLAIELAAARLRMLNPEQISSRLDDRFRLLTGGSRTALPRQQTLRALIDWSYDLLSENERLLLRRLAVFTGGWTLELAEQVCSDEKIDQYEVLDMLGKLVDKSLVEVTEDSKETRYRMLETVRQYAREKLFESGEGERARDRHLQAFVELAEKAKPEIRSFGQLVWLDRLEAEIDNLRAALEWSLNHDAETELEIATALLWFWLWREYYREGWQWLTAGLSQSETSGQSLTQAKALNAAAEMSFYMGDIAAARIHIDKALAIFDKLKDAGVQAESTKLLGLLAWQQSDYAAGLHHLQDGLTLFKQLGDKLGIADCLHFLGHQALDQSDYASARACFEESMKLLSEMGDTLGTIPLVKDLGLVAYLQGDSVSARVYYEECLALARRMANQDSTGEALNMLGDLARYEGDDQQAETLYNENLALLRNVGIKRNIPSVFHNLAYVALRQGNAQKAAGLFAESMSLFQEQSDKKGVAECLAGLAGALTVQGKAKQAAALFGSAESAREALGVVLWPANQVAHDQNIAIARAQLSEEAFNQAWTEGKAMSMEEAIKYALENIQ